jgi:hypothetical protein
MTSSPILLPLVWVTYSKLGIITDIKASTDSNIPDSTVILVNSATTNLFDVVPSNHT